MISEISRGYELNGTRGAVLRLKAFSTSLPFFLNSANRLIEILLIFFLIFFSKPLLELQNHDEWQTEEAL